MKTFDKTSIMVRGYFSGIYEWGEGWKEGKREKWNEYLSSLKKPLWRHIKVNDGVCDIDYLLEVSNIIYLHPLMFNAVLNSNGVKTNGSYFDIELEALDKICAELAEYCGGTFRMEVSQEVTTTYKVIED